MNKLIKYSGYFIVFIIFTLIFLKVLEKLGFGCFYGCNEYVDMRGKNIVVKGDNTTYINGKKS